MTPRQRYMARQALGLTNDRANGKSYRNYYASPLSGDTEEQWDDLVSKGLAEKGKVSGTGRTVTFWLTPAGAQAALDDGETLDKEDFPS